MLIASAVFQPAPAGGQTRYEKTTVAYRAVGEHEVLVDVHRPAGHDERQVIVWIHGGALIMGGREGVPQRIVSLAKEQGFAYVSIDYRLAPETKLPEIIDDIEAAFRWLASEGANQFHLNPDRIVVCGSSAGGYLTLVTGYRAVPRPMALVALFGYGDLTGDWYSKPSPHLRHNRRTVSAEEAAMQTDGTVISNARQRTGNGGLIYLHYRQHGIWPLEVSGFDRATIAEKIAPFEPVRNVTAEFPPTLLIHGDSDTDVPYEQSQMMAAQLRHHRVPFTLKTIENGEHGLGGGDPQQIEDAYQFLREFIVEHLTAE
jgi:acetyl esterase/lipase